VYEYGAASSALVLHLTLSGSDMLPLMPTELFNGTGSIYLNIDYDAAGDWVYCQWRGRQSYISVVAGAEAALLPLSENACAYMLSDNREVVGAWDHGMEWLLTEWVTHAAEQGLTHLAHVLSPEAMAAHSAETMCRGLKSRVRMRLFTTLLEAEAWLRQAQRKAARSELTKPAGLPTLHPEFFAEQQLKYA
jgi:hypothetical protein